jgi:putative endonuclease
MRTYYVYILSNCHRTVFYTGVTNNLARRLSMHRSGHGSRFAAKYRCFDLVYFETHSWIQVAIDREKQIKRWGRKKKCALIHTVNPSMKDLTEALLYEP